MANMLERLEELHRRVTELEQRVPKPIPVVEPLRNPVPGLAVAIAVEGATEWKERAERAEALLRKWRSRHSGNDPILDETDALLARARVAKAGP